MTFSMTMTLTNDSLILLGLVVAGLSLCLYGYCKEGGDAIGLQQQQQHEAVLLQEEINQDEVEDDEARENVTALDEVLKQDEDEDEARNRDHDNVLEGTIQDQIEDEARHNEALLEEILNQEEEEGANEGGDALEDNSHAMILYNQQHQQQYRVRYNPAIFRNPNVGMISSSQMIRNLYNIATGVNNQLQLQLQQVQQGLSLIHI